MIGVIIPSLTNPFFSSVIQSMEDHKPDHVDLFFLSTSEAQIEENIKHLVERGMDGLIIARFIHHPVDIDAYLKKHHVPYIVLDQSEDHDFTDVIRTNEWEGGRLAAEHLVKLNHKQLAIVHPELLMANMHERVKGFEAYCEIHGQAMPLKIATTLSMDGGKAIVPKLIESGVTAAFAINDEMAIGIMRGLAEQGLRVPEDFSVIGYDDIAISQFLTPALTTVAQPMSRIGATAIQLMLKKIKSPEAELEKVALENQLIVRETTQRI
nr:substrate-binding domain-containing protein [Staphylococcus canis]